MSFDRAIRVLAVLAFLSVASPMTSAQVSPTQNSADVSRGIQLYREGKYDESSKLLKKVVKQTKTDEQAWYYLGLSLIRKKELKEATKALETAISLRPNSAPSHAGLGYALLLRSRFEGALSEAQKALSVNSGLVDAHYIAGVAYLRLGKRESALKEADAVLQLDPKFANAYLLKSQALVSFIGDVLIREETVEPFNDRYSQARDALEKFLQLSPKTEDSEIWTTQLESLRFFATPRKGTDKSIYSNKEVTTKARILAKPEPVYTERARRNGITGTVVLRAVFTAAGEVKYIIIVRDLPDGLTQQAVAAARRIKFVPATVDGRPVSMYFQLEYNFNLY